jgi:hypothetical protein
MFMQPELRNMLAETTHHARLAEIEAFQRLPQSHGRVVDEHPDRLVDRVRAMWRHMVTTAFPVRRPHPTRWGTTAP